MLVVFIVIASTLIFVPAFAKINNDGSKYNFAYSTGDEGDHKRQEIGNIDGSVSGTYSYLDPNGNLRSLRYKAGPGIGFQAFGDTGVDKKTAEEASKISILAPRITETPSNEQDFAKLNTAVEELKSPISPFNYAMHTKQDLHAMSVAPSSVIDDSKYNFAYSTGDEGNHKRQEIGKIDGSVSGTYSYLDPNGNLRSLRYKAGPGIGFQAFGDTGIDKKTAEEAANITLSAPKAPEIRANELNLPSVEQNELTAELKEPAIKLQKPIFPFTYTLPGVPHLPPAATHFVYNQPLPLLYNVLPYGLVPHSYIL